MREIDEREYVQWLASQGVPEAHFRAHRFALQLFREHGDCTASSMHSQIAHERQQGAAESRLRNLQAASDYIARFSRFQEEELELMLLPLPGDAKSSSSPSYKESVQSELELELDEELELALDQRAKGGSPQVQIHAPTAPRVPTRIAKRECACSDTSTPVAVTSLFLFTGPILPFLYYALRFYEGKRLAVLVNWGILTLVMFAGFLLALMKCEVCDEELDTESLPLTAKRSLARMRGLVLLLGIFFSVLTYRVYKPWAEERRIDNLSSEEYFEELEREYREEVEAELGYELSEEEFEAYEREIDEEDRRELEEYIGRPLTDEEWEGSE